MKKKFLAVGLVIAVALSSLAVSACSMFDNDVKVVLNNMGEIQNTYIVSIFKNAVLADITTDHVIGVAEIEEEGVTVTKDIEFLGWHPDPGAANGFYKAKGLLRLAEMKEYVRDGVLVLYAIYGVKVIEKHDLIIGWYGQAVAGLTDAIMESFETALRDWLEDEVKMHGLDIVFRKYIGDVATSCSEIVADGGADILFGWGGNLTSLGGVATLDRQSGIAMGNKTGRYIDLIRETVIMFDAETSLSRKVWEWSVSNAALFL